MDDLLKVVTWKWDNGVHAKKHIKFTSEHVNRFYRMLDRNTTVPYESVCVTDNPEGIDPHIRIVPLWNDLREMGGCYTRLKCFSPEIKEIIGENFIWFDLDTVIVGNMDHILSDPSTLKFWGDTHPRTPYNGSMVKITSGVRNEIWEEFDPRNSPRLAKRCGFVGTDQAWISYKLGPAYPKWGQADGVYSFRCHIEKLKRIDLPTNAKIIMFHGRFDPSQPELQNKYPWIKQHWR